VQQHLTWLREELHQRLGVAVPVRLETSSSGVNASATQSDTLGMLEAQLQNLLQAHKVPSPVTPRSRS
ncbi:MAG: hypothetical protein NZ473_07735, partial [Candidatus Kapabacteria bacterium]|nr:hypothetical protein [Candidatus Kapabacteria bacterium]